MTAHERAVAIDAKFYDIQRYAWMAASVGENDARYPSEIRRYADMIATLIRQIDELLREAGA